MTAKLSLLVVLVFSIQTYAQPEVDTQRRNLVGASGRTWSFLSFDSKIDGGLCTPNAEIWTFTPSGRVNIKRCTPDGRIQRSEGNWSISKEGIDYIVTVGGTKYRFIYSKPAPAKHQMRLRFVSGAKQDASTDRVFKYSGN